MTALLPAFAGYGDPVDGYPNWAERELHLYTNAARVDPEAHEESYQAGGCSFYQHFSDDEQTPKDPVYWQFDLNDAARYHSDDMHANDWFSHDSSDGTSFQQRMANFYPKSGSVGENIAYGYPDQWAVNFEGWMCSTDGHRANIMSGMWNELGTGVVSNYYTQDFGGGTPETGLNIRMGVHTPQMPRDGSEDITFYADYAGEALSGIFVVLDGEPYPLEVVWGTDERGVFAVEIELAFEDDGAYCGQYYFWYEDADGEGTFPEEGSYLLGAACDEDWVAEQIGAGGFTSGDGSSSRGSDLMGDIRLVGCSATGVAGAAWLLPLVGLARRRRSL